MKIQTKVFGASVELTKEYIPVVLSLIAIIIVWKACF